jgi:hypothetical protein
MCIHMGDSLSEYLKSIYMKLPLTHVLQQIWNVKIWNQNVE